MALSKALGAIGALIAVIIAQEQLQNLVDSYRMTGLMAVLQIEAELQSRADKIDELNMEIRQRCLDSQSTMDQIEILNDRKTALEEAYLNAVDRFAFCILKKYIDDKDWKHEYQAYFNRIVESLPAFFESDTYDNILALRQRWNEPSNDSEFVV